MGFLGNSWQLWDYLNAKTCWIENSNKSHRQINIYKFVDYQDAGNQPNPSEAIRIPVYNRRLDHVWIEMVKVYDTVKAGYFTTGDLQVYSEFVLQGYSPSYTIDGNVILEYAGDLIEWNGKLWGVADMLEPVQWGYMAKQVLYKTVMRKTQRTNIGIKVGP